MVNTERKMEAATKIYLRPVSFANLNLWDVKKYRDSINHYFENVVTLADILIPIKKPISKFEMIKNKWQIISKINFSGKLFLRDFEEISRYKGNLNLVPDNAVIYSKINVRHGCIYYHEKGKAPFGVSSEYPTYTFDEKKVDGKFLHKLLRSTAFKKLLNTKTTGISKARVKQDQFLNIEIPLPTIEEQQRIIETYYGKIKEATTLLQQTKNLENEIDEYLNAELGIKKNIDVKFKKGLNTINYVSLTKWSLNHLNKSRQIDFENAKYGTEKIKSLLKFFEGGKTPSKSNLQFWNGDIFWASPKDFNGQGTMKTAQDKISRSALKEVGMKLYPKGTILSVFRSGILQHSFPTVITNIETTINQDLKAYSFHEEKIDKQYYLMFTQIFKKYVLAKASKKSVTVESINTEDFMNIPIPLPPLPIQKEIVNNIQAKKEKIQIIEANIKSLHLQAEEEFEKQLFN